MPQSYSLINLGIIRRGGLLPSISININIFTDIDDNHCLIDFSPAFIFLDICWKENGSLTLSNRLLRYLKLFWNMFFKNVKSNSTRATNTRFCLNIYLSLGIFMRNIYSTLCKLKSKGICSIVKSEDICWTELLLF